MGGFLDFFDDTCAMMVQPRTSFYVESARDAVGGEAQLCDQEDFALGILTYFKDPGLIRRHGEECRRRITCGDTYRWPSISTKLATIVRDIHDETDRSKILDIPRAEVHAMMT